MLAILDEKPKAHPYRDIAIPPLEHEDDQWHSFTVTYGGGEEPVRLFVDGAEQHYDEQGEPLPRVKAGTHEVWARGPHVASTAFYDPVLSAEEVRKIYNNGCG